MFIGGNQSGKTTWLISEVDAWCRGFYPWSGERVKNRLTWEYVEPPIRAMIGAKNFVSAHAEVIIPKHQELVNWKVSVARTERLQGQIIHKIHYPEDLGGSSIKFFSYDQDPQNAEGTTWDVAGFDEPPPRDILIATQRGCMAKSAPIFMAFTPLREAYLFDEYYERAHHAGADDLRVLENPEAHPDEFKKIASKRVFSITIGMSENPHLPSEQREIYEEFMDEDEREARVHGRFKHLMGRVYKMFRREDHVERKDLRDGIEERDGGRELWWPVGCVMDPHGRRPFMIGWFVITPEGQRHWLAEWPDDFMIHQCRSWEWGVEEYARRIREIEAGDNNLGLVLGHVEWRVIDPQFGRSKSPETGRTLQEAFLADADMYFDTNVENDIDAGHLAVKEALRRSLLSFDPGCKNLIKAMESYTWDEYRDKGDRPAKEKPAELHKDPADVVRYGQMYEAGFYDPREDAMPVVDWSSMENMGLGR